MAAERPDIGPTEREIAGVLRQASSLASDRVSVSATTSAEQPIAANFSDQQRAEAHANLRLEALEDAVSRLARAIDRLRTGAD